MTTPLIDLSQVPPPAIVEDVSFEAIVADVKARLVAALPDRTDLPAMLARESEPITKFCELVAYRETLLRHRVNAAAKASLLSHAEGDDLDARAGDLYGIERQTIVPADPETGADAVRENDPSLRDRARLSLFALSTAGPVPAYRAIALSADPDVKDVYAVTPAPGQMRVTILSHSGHGVPPQGLLDKITALYADTVPATDQVIVAGARVAFYTITAELTVPAGPSQAAILDQARTAAATYADEAHALGRRIDTLAIGAALYRPGVTRVALIAPGADLVVAPDQAGYASAINVTLAGGGV